MICKPSIMQSIYTHSNAGTYMKTQLKTILGLALVALTWQSNAACPSTSLSQNTKLIKDNKALSLKDGKLVLNGGSETLLRKAMQLASDKGRKLTISGTYRISQDIPTIIKRKVYIDASNARFIATSRLQGDLISFNTTPSSLECPKDPSFSWTGGKFDVWDHPTSTVVPGTQSANKGDSSKGSKSTADALSIRGDTTKDGKRRRHLGNLEISGITVTGTEFVSETYRHAGGDSGILMIAAKSAYIHDNKFYGIRDAAVYLSADNTGGTLGDNFTLENNYAERVYDAFTVKRGADNIKFLNNKVLDAVVAISTKSTNKGSKWNGNNIVIDGNEITKSIRAISLERSFDVSINNNTIKQLGANVAGEQNANANRFKVSYTRTDSKGNTSVSNVGTYEGISLNGVDRLKSIKNNTISGSNGKTRRVNAVVFRKFDGQSTSRPNISSTDIAKWRGISARIVKGKDF